MIRRVAAIDCGTNSLRLLVADVDAERATLADIDRRMEIVRLGQGVDKTGRLAPEALDRTMGALERYARIITSSGAEAVRMVATSATRDAENSAEFVRRVKEVLGAPPEVLAGDAEARLSFTGATAELAGEPGSDPPYLVLDIGGGSTEFVLGGPTRDAGGPAAGVTGVPGGAQDGAGAPAGEVIAAVSVNVGCVRMTERNLRSDPPDERQVAAASADIDAAIDAAVRDVPARQARTLVGLAGSVTTVAGIALDLSAYDPARIHHSRITAPRVREVTRALLAQTREQRAAIPVMHPGRVDVIAGGALILDRVMARLGFGEVLVSEHDILDGIAWSLAASASR